MTKRNINENPEVAAVFDAYPEKVKAKLMFLRQLIFDVASRTDGVGELEETLKWGSRAISQRKQKAGVWSESTR